MARGVLTLRVEASIDGPLGDGTADRLLKEWAQNTAKALGDEGADMLRSFPMNKTGRAHGGFESNIHVIQKGPVVRIPGPVIEGVTWSPWLEGTSKRNESTRFKGYHLFRKTRQELQRRAQDVGQRELDKIMPRLGGE